MSKKLVTKVRIILDRSGSMQSIADQAVKNFNEQIQQMKANSDTQEIYCSLITFNGEVFEHLWDKPASELEEAEEGTYITTGSTALYDALGYSINKNKETTEDPDSDVVYLYYIISDGDENASKKYNQNSIAKLIKQCNEEGNYTFTYMGCDRKYVEEVSRGLNIPISNCAVWSANNSHEADATLTAASMKYDNFYSGRTKGVRSVMNFHSDSSQVEDYTEGISSSVQHPDLVAITSSGAVSLQSLGFGATSSAVGSYTSGVGVSSNPIRTCGNTVKPSSNSRGCASGKCKTNPKDENGVFLKSTKVSL